MVRLAICLFSIVALTGCFRRWSMTDKEIQQHYTSRKARPTYHTFSSDSCRLFVATLGPDTLPPLLLIHGAPGNWYGYLHNMDDSLLQQRFQIIAVTRPGYGKSRLRRSSLRLKKRMSIDFQARTIAKALSLNHSGKKAVLLGRSYGAPIAVRLAALLPEQVGHLFLISPAIDPDREKFWWFSGWGRMPFVQVFLPRSLNLATYEKYAHADQLRQLVPHWAKLRPPVTVVQGDQDWIIDQGNIAFARRMLANKKASFHLLPKAGHLITSTHAELIRTMLLQTADSLYQQTPVRQTSHSGGH